MDAILLRFKTPSKADLFEDLKALLTAADMGGFLPARAGEMIAPWRRAGYRLDWVFFRVLRDEFDRGLHCDVLVSRFDPSKPPVRRRLAAIRGRIGDLEGVDHDSPRDLLARYAATRRRVRRAARGSVVLDEITMPYHAFSESTNG